MKRASVQKEIEMPEGIEFNVEGNFIIVKKDSMEIKRKMDRKIKAVKSDNKIILTIDNARRCEKRMIGSIASHIKNIFEGFSKPWEYELEICHTHFPVTVTFDKAKGEFIVKNLLGERAPRVIKAECPEKIEVEIKAPHIKIKSYDLEVSGQNAANLEKVSKIRYRDRNKFQDGIFITKKPGKSYL